MKKVKKINDAEPKLGCLMLYFNHRDWKKYVKSLVDEKDLYKPKDDDYGYCKYPHTTILFGIHDYDTVTKDIQKYILNLKKLDDIKIKGVSLFENEGFDVVKFDIKSKKLEKINEKICDKFDYTNEYDYHPHLTISYVKKGLGKKYDGMDIEKPELVNSNYVYSDPNYKKKIIN